MVIDMDQVQGICASSMTSVKRAFEENFKSRGDLGASVSVYWNGECLVDLWGGQSINGATPLGLKTLWSIFGRRQKVSQLPALLWQLIVEFWPMRTKSQTIGQSFFCGREK